MPRIAYIAHFIAAAFLTNGIPHFVNDVSGRRFRNPLAKPGSPIVNVVWGGVNFLIALLPFANIGALGDTIFVAAGMLVTSILLAPIFEGESR